MLIPAVGQDPAQSRNENADFPDRAGKPVMCDERECTTRSSGLVLLHSRGRGGTDSAPLYAAFCFPGFLGASGCFSAFPDFCSTS